MKKRLKRYGVTMILSFSADDVKIFNLKEGDIVDVNLEDKVNWKEIRKRVKKRGKR